MARNSDAVGVDVDVGGRWCGGKGGRGREGMGGWGWGGERRE